MRRKILITAFISISLVWNAFSQLQVGQGINGFYNRVPEVHNFALLPLNSVPTLSLIGGSRLAGFGRHPVQASFICSGNLMDKLSAGLKINYDQAGLSSKTDIQLGLSYYVFLNRESSDVNKNSGDKFSFSLSGHFIQDKIKLNSMLVLDPNDPKLLNISEMSPGGNASVAIAFLRENKYYAGISAYQLLPTKSSFLNTEWKNTKRRHYYLMGSYSIALSQKTPMILEINAIGAIVNFDAFQWQAGVDFRLNQMLTIGAGYISNGAIKADIGVTAQSWSFGYLCNIGLSGMVDAAKYSYKGINNMVFIRKIFNEGRRSNQ